MIKPAVPIIAIVVRVFAFVALILWLGGFTFYASFVVPIGTDVLGSTTAQGMITRQVTVALNQCCGVATFLLAADLGMLRRFRARWANSVLLGCIVSIGALLIWLVWLHQSLDGMIDVENEMVDDAEAFYSLHRVYLWVNSAQWLAACVWLVVALLPLKQSISETDKPTS